MVFLTLSPKETMADPAKVKVTLPSFTVSLNGHTVENDSRDYPLLVYKDITYVPMTWYDGRLLGLETEWTEESGLSIRQGKITSSYAPYKTDVYNSPSYTAAIPSFKIEVNGKSITNSKEEYPLLSFRDVIYFPLTWRFAHDEFGWSYEWDSKEGLRIFSGNPQLEAVNLPTYAAQNDVVLFKGYYYYVETVDTTNTIYRLPAEGEGSPEPVYSFDGKSGYGFHKDIRFEIRDGALWFSYHLGGATHGANYYVKVTDDGTAAEKHRGYLDFRETPYGSLIISHGVPPGGGNLSLDLPDGTKKGVGNPNLIYGWYIQSSEGGARAFAGEGSTTVVGDEVYILASVYPVEAGSSNRLYKVNLKTNVTKKVIDQDIASFQLRNNKLFYIKSADGRVYSANLDGSGEAQVSDRKANWFGSIGDTVYYTVMTDERLLELYKADPAVEDSRVVGEKLQHVELVDERILCKLAEAEGNGFKVLDSSGELLMTVADPVKDVWADGDLLLLISELDHSVKRLWLF